MPSHSSHSSRPSGSSSRHRDRRGHHHRDHPEQQQYAYANYTSKLRLWFCHVCGEGNNWDLTSRCLRQNCEHDYCRLCEYEEHEVRDYQRQNQRQNQR